MSTSVRQAFLSELEPALVPRFIEWGHAIERLEVDVCMAMARKAACLVDAMVDLGLLVLPAQLVSDRLLDMDKSWLRGRRVALVDDIVVSGSTLYKTAEAIRSAGGDVVTTVVIGVDMDWWNPDLVQPVKPYAELGDQQALALSVGAVDALSVLPRPYNVDWPLFDGVTLPRAASHILSAFGQWVTVDTTSTTQSRHGVVSVVHEADQRTRAALEERLGLPLQAAKLVKVRIYGRVTPGSPRRLDLRILPIVAFDELSKDSVDGLFDALASRLVSRGRSLADFATHSSRLRLIQYVVAAHLGRIWLKDLLDQADASDSQELDLGHLALVFSPHTAPLVRELAECREQVFGGCELVPAVAKRPYRPRGGPFQPMNAWSTEARLAEPFRRLYREKELPARRLLFERGPAAFADPKLAGLLDRLNQGYSLGELERIASPSQHEGPPSRVVSAFLDLAVDRGVVVPVMSVTDGTVIRAYRHGEDIEFADNEFRLFGLMLASLAKGMGVTELPSLVVEKMCVLFLRIGVATGHLNRFNGRLGATGTVGVRYTLLGAVVEQQSSSLFDSNTANGLTEMLKEAGVVTRHSGAKYTVGRVPSAPTTTAQEGLADQVGWAFGRLLSSEAGARLDRGELTLLATCSDEHQLAAALAAEVSIVTRRWPAEKQRLLLGDDPGSTDRRSLSQSPPYGAANSGSWKYRKYRDGEVRGVVDRIASQLGDPMYVGAWRTWHGPSVLTSPRAASDLSDLADDLGRWLLLSRTCLTITALAEELSTGRAIAVPQWNARTRDLVADLDESARDHQRFLGVDKSEATRLAVDVHARLAAGEIDTPVLLLEGATYQDRMMRSGRALLDRARAMVDTFGRPRTLVIFSSALFVTRTADRGAVAFDASVATLVRTARKIGGRRGVRLDTARIEGTPEGLLVLAADRKGQSVLPRLAVAIAAAAPATVGVRIGIVATISAHERVYTGDPTGVYHGDGFAQMLREIAARPEMLAGSGTMITVYGDPETCATAVEACESAAASKGLRLLSDVSEPSSTSPASRTLAVGGLEPETSVRADLGILTVLTEETRAVREWLSARPDFLEWPDSQNRFYYSASVPSDSGHVLVVATQAADQGDRSIMNAHIQLTRGHRPRAVVLLGVAGGINKRIRSGDVVVATDVVAYDQRADTPGGTRRRGVLYQQPAHVRNALVRFFTLEGEPVDLLGSSRTPGGPGRFRLLQGPIGTGGAVVKSLDSDIREWLLTFNEKLLAVETEAAGVASYFFENATTDDLRSYLVVRGISDHADGDKNDAWKVAASENAVVALQLLLTRVGSLLTGSSRRPPRKNARSKLGRLGRSA